MAIKITKDHRSDDSVVFDNDHIAIPGTMKRFVGRNLNTSIVATEIARIIIPGNEVYDGMVINWKAWSAIINSSGATRTLQFRLYVNNTLVYHDTTGNIATSATNLSHLTDMYFSLNEDLGLVYTNGMFLSGGRDAPTVGGIGGMATSVVVPTGPFQGGNANWRPGDDLNIYFTIQLSNSEATSGFNNTNNIVIINPR